MLPAFQLYLYQIITILYYWNFGAAIWGVELFFPHLWNYFSISFFLILAYLECK